MTPYFCVRVPRQPYCLGVSPGDANFTTVSSSLPLQIKRRRPENENKISWTFDENATSTLALTVDGNYTLAADGFDRILLRPKKSPRELRFDWTPIDDSSGRLISAGRCVTVAKCRMGPSGSCDPTSNEPITARVQIVPGTYVFLRSCAAFANVAQIFDRTIDCADGCSYVERRNGICDAPCDVEECSFDDGACVNATSAPSFAPSSPTRSPSLSPESSYSPSPSPSESQSPTSIPTSSPSSSPELYTLPPSASPHISPSYSSSRPSSKPSIRGTSPTTSPTKSPGALNVDATAIVVSICSFVVLVIGAAIFLARRRSRRRPSIAEPRSPRSSTPRTPIGSAASEIEVPEGIPSTRPPSDSYSENEDDDVPPRPPSRPPPPDVDDVDDDDVPRPPSHPPPPQDDDDVDVAPEPTPPPGTDHAIPRTPPPSPSPSPDDEARRVREIANDEFRFRLETSEDPRAKELSKISEWKRTDDAKRRTAESFVL